MRNHKLLTGSILAVVTLALPVASEAASWTNFGGVFNQAFAPTMTKGMELGLGKINAYVVDQVGNTVVNVEMQNGPFSSRVTSLGFSTPFAPAAAEWSNRRTVIAVNMAKTQLFFAASQSDQAFSAWSQAGTFPGSAGICGAPNAVSWGPGRIDVFVRGCDANIWQATLLNNSWNWAGRGRGPGTTLGYDPIASSPDGARVDVWVPADGEVEDDQYNGSGWTGRLPLTPNLIFSIASSPIHATGGQSVISGAVVGLDANGQLIGLGDDMWASHGFSFPSASNIFGWGAPSTATFSPNAIVAYGLDASQHVARVQLFFNGFAAKWVSMSNGLGGANGEVFTGRVGVMADLNENGSENIFVFAYKQNGNLYFSPDAPF